MISLLSALSIALSVQNGPSSFVNPFIGATTEGGPDSAGLGKTFPGAITPFGMVQLSPDTVTGGDNGPGYSYSHKSIEGFSFTHMSGIGWYGDLGNLLVMPTTGPLVTNSGNDGLKIDGYRSPFRHETETATPGYYQVDLDKYHVRSEMTVTPHAGILRFTYPKNNQSRIQIDLARRIGGTSVRQFVKVVDDHTIEGWMRCTPEGGGWGNGDGHPNYTVYFYGPFSKALMNFGVWSGTISAGTDRRLKFTESKAFQDMAGTALRLPGQKEFEGDHIGFYSDFPTKPGEQVMFRSGISFSSIDSARANLKAELTTWDFDKIRRQAKERWDQALGQVTVSGGTAEQKRVFYSALYHTAIDPRSITDVNGTHPSGDGSIGHSKGFTYRSIFSGWDVYRSEMPLLSIIRPQVLSDDINSLVELSETSGKHYLERWEFLNAYSGCMIGNPAVVMINDAYQKGIRSFNVAKAYEACRNSVERDGTGKLGYIPEDLSQTLEDSFSEWCIGRFAAETGHKADSQKYLARGANYRNLFDPSSGWFRAKDASGNWLPWPKEGKVGWVWCEESNPLQQGWFVPQNTSDLAMLLGGNASATKQLEEFFEKTPKGMMWNEYYNHANEPVHHAAFLFNRFGAPWLTQKWVRRILTEAYKNGVEGLCGNDDVGQMSAWYVLAALGFHPICPGEGTYELCGPLFDRAEISVPRADGGYRKFSVVANRKSQADVYIQSVRLNGQLLKRTYITHQEVVKGGTLVFTMGNTPNKAWGQVRANG